MPESISAAEAALMASTSCGLTWSAPKMVPTTWTSLRKPVGEGRAQGPVDQAAGQDGLVRGLALPAEERAGDLAGGVGPLLDVDGEREEVGPLPDRPGGGGRGQQDGVADAGRRTAPSASWANLPVSKVRVRSVPLIGPDTEMASAMMLLVWCWGHLVASSQWSTTSGGSDRRLAASVLRGPDVNRYRRMPRRPMMLR